MENVSPPLTNAQRKAILKRDKWRCRYCGSQRELQVDHIFPRSLGGGNQAENLAVACRECNLKKLDKVGTVPGPIQRNPYEGAKNIVRFGWFLLFWGALQFIVLILSLSFVVLISWVILRYVAEIPGLPALGIAYLSVMLVPFFLLVRALREKPEDPRESFNLLFWLVSR